MAGFGGADGEGGDAGAWSVFEGEGDGVGFAGDPGVGAGLGAAEAQGAAGGVVELDAEVAGGWAGAGGVDEVAESEQS